MFPINRKWIDDMYNKIESVCIQVDDIIFKEQESTKYVEDLKNVGNNVKQFCSTMDPLKYVEDQLTNVGTTVEQLYSSVVPASVDTMLCSAVNNIFLLEPDSTACTKSDLNGSMAEPVTSVEMKEVASTGQFGNSNLDLGDQYHSNRPVAEPFTSVEMNELASTGQFGNSNLDLGDQYHLNRPVAEPFTSVEMNELASTGQFGKSKLDLEVQYDSNSSVADTVTSADMNEEVASTGKFEDSQLDLEDNTTQTDQYFDDDSSTIYDEFGIDKGPSYGFCSPGQTAEVELKEETNADDKITRSPEKVQLEESCVFVDKSDWFTSEAPVDVESPKIKLPSPPIGQIQSHVVMKTKSKSSIGKKPCSTEKEPALSLHMTSSNLDAWESEWEII